MTGQQGEEREWGASLGPEGWPGSLGKRNRVLVFQEPQSSGLGKGGTMHACQGARPLFSVSAFFFPFFKLRSNSYNIKLSILR